MLKDHIHLPSNRLFKLLGCWLVSVCICFLVLVIVEDALKNIGLCGTNTAKMVKFILNNMTLMGSAWMYLKIVDPGLLQEIRKTYVPMFRASFLAIGLSILNLLFLVCSMKLIEKYFPSFSTNYLSDTAAQREWISFTYKDLSLPMFLLSSIVGTALVPAFSEELFFRGVLQAILLKKFKRTWMAIGITAMIFVITHGIGYMAIIMLFIPAVLYGSLYYQTKNIFITILMHFFHNSLVGWIRYASQKNIASDASIDVFLSVSVCCTLLPLCLFLGYLCFKILVNQSCRSQKT